MIIELNTQINDGIKTTSVTVRGVVYSITHIAGDWIVNKRRLSAGANLGHGSYEYHSTFEAARAVRPEFAGLTLIDCI